MTPIFNFPVQNTSQATAKPMKIEEFSSSNAEASSGSFEQILNDLQAPEQAEIETTEGIELSREEAEAPSAPNHVTEDATNPLKTKQTSLVDVRNEPVEHFKNEETSLSNAQGTIALEVEGTANKQNFVHVASDLPKELSQSTPEFIEIKKQTVISAKEVPSGWASALDQVTAAPKKLRSTEQKATGDVLGSSYPLAAKSSDVFLIAKQFNPVGQQNVTFPQSVKVEVSQFSQLSHNLTDESAMPTQLSAPNKELPTNAAQQTTSLGESAKNAPVPQLLSFKDDPTGIPLTETHEIGKSTSDPASPDLRLLQPVAAPQFSPKPGQVSPILAASNSATLSDAIITLREAGGQIDVSLTPDDLGRLTIKLEHTANGALVTLAAERPETQEMMRRQMEHLQNQFKGMGFDNLSFSFEQNQTESHTDERAGERENLSGTIPTDQNMATIALTVSAGGLDIRI